MRHVSPLRYPGGKAALTDFLAQTIELNGLSGCRYFEPFAGGAGAALQLLLRGVVSELHLNDLDPRITAFWNAALNESERFMDAILKVPVSIEEWNRQKEVCHNPRTSGPFELGFAAFYLNRCNRSGVILGAAPIGGYEQKGRWKIDARFYRERLAERVRTLAATRERIQVTEMDARDFIAKRLPRGNGWRRAFVYLDPPYYSKGSRLYMDSYGDRDHEDLARRVQRRTNLNWVLSYDDTDFVRRLYASCAILPNTLQYSLQRKRRVRELLIAPHHLQTPSDLFGTHDSVTASV